MTAPDPTPTVYRRARALRIQRGWSARELAERLTTAGHPVERSVITRGEIGLRPSITVARLYALAYVFQVDPVALLADPTCDACNDAPPTGYACLTCRKETR